MKNKTLLLLRTLLLSTSQRNIYKHTRDKKKRNRIVANAVGMGLLYVMLMAYSILVCIGFGLNGSIDAAPVMCALLVSALAFVFTLFRTNGYLFGFKEYDMLMSLPFETKTVAACKFLYMVIKSLPWYLSISLALMAGYGYYARPSAAVYPLWILLTLFLPVIPTLFAAFLGFLTAKISSGFKHKNLIQTVLVTGIIIFSFSLRFILEDLFKNDKVDAALEQLSALTGNVGKYYPPAGWFADAVAKPDLLKALLLIAVSLLLFAAVFAVVARSYRSINSALRTQTAAKNYKMTAQNKRSVVNAIAFKEFKRLTGSVTYMTNAGIGVILAVLFGIVCLIIGTDRIASAVLQGAPLSSDMLEPAIPFIVYFFIGMIATTACSPSLEGKNYWIVQSLPIEKKTLYQGKMLFNLYLTVPAMVFSTLCLCISGKVPLLHTLLYLVFGFALCAFSTAWGCVCGIRHMRLDWENEVEVIKQGTAVTVYLLPNMFAVMALMGLSVYLGTRMNYALLTLIFILIASVLAGLSYLRAMALAKRTF